MMPHRTSSVTPSSDQTRFRTAPRKRRIYLQKADVASGRVGERRKVGVHPGAADPCIGPGVIASEAREVVGPQLPTRAGRGYQPSALVVNLGRIHASDLFRRAKRRLEAAYPAAFDRVTDRPLQTPRDHFDLGLHAPFEHLLELVLRHGGTPAEGDGDWNDDEDEESNRKQTVVLAKVCQIEPVGRGDTDFAAVATEPCGLPTRAW